MTTTTTGGTWTAPEVDSAEVEPFEEADGAWTAPEVDRVEVESFEETDGAEAAPLRLLRMPRR